MASSNSSTPCGKGISATVVDARTSAPCRWKSPSCNGTPAKRARSRAGCAFWSTLADVLDHDLRREHVVQLVEVSEVDPRAAADGVFRVVAGGKQLVVAPQSEQNIRAGVAVERVLAGAALEAVIAAVAFKFVVAVAAAEVVGGGTSEQRIVARAALHRSGPPQVGVEADEVIAAAAVELHVGHRGYDEVENDGLSIEPHVMLTG